MSFTSEQTLAVNAMINPAEKCVVVQAPPGCGKTHLVKWAATQLPGRTLITARNVAICNDLAMAFGLPKEMGTTSDGKVTVLNFDKITGRATDVKGRKLTGVFFSLGSPKRDTKFLAQALGISPIPVGDSELSVQAVAGLVETAYQRFCRSGDTKAHWGHVSVMVESDERIDQSLREGIADRVNMLSAMIDKAAVNAGKVDRFPIVTISTKFAAIAKAWAENGFQIAADNIVIDEAQDLDRLFLRAIDTWLKQGKKVILCGDKYQELYAWAGARNAMAFAIREFGASEFRLTQSHRFGPSIAAKASQIIEPLAGPTSVVGLKADVEDAGQTANAFLFPTNAQSMGKAVSLYEQGVKCEIPYALADEIEKIVKDLRDISNGIRAKGPLSMYGSRSQVDKAVKEDERMADVAKILQLADEFSFDILLSVVAEASCKVFTGKAPAITTIHRTKGVEWDVVECTLPTRKVDPKTFLPREWTDVERMQIYVGITRGRQIVRVFGEL